MKLVKNLLCAALAFIVVFSLAACGKESNYYNETVFESLKSFTDISGSEPVSIDKDFASTTTYEYLLTEKADKLIFAYEEYLTEYGFTTDSDTSKEALIYKSDNYELVFSSTETDNGVSIKITIPCDEATINSRNEAIYIEIENAFNNKEYENVTNISKRLYGEHKNSDYYTKFATGMYYYDMGIWPLAYEALQSFSDNAEAKACIKEITSYNGIYKCSQKYLDYYILIKNGEVSMQYSSIYSPEGYQPGDSVYYIYDLINRVLPNGERQLMIGSHYSDYDKYDYGFLALKDGTFLAGHYETNPYDTFNGIYKKISDTPSAEK